MKDIQVMVADESHVKYVDTILQTIADAAKVRGTGIAKRSPEYVATKMREAKAVIALEGERFAGFSYIETWGNKHYVTTSGLIVHPDYRGLGLAKRIKNLTFTLARVRWPHAKIFSLTSGSAVMTMNTPVGLPSRDLQRPHRRRGLLARLPGMHQPRCAGAHRTKVLHLHRHALRPRRAPARQDFPRGHGAHTPHRRAEKHGHDDLRRLWGVVAR